MIVNVVCVLEYELWFKLHFVLTELLSDKAHRNWQLALDYLVKIKIISWLVALTCSHDFLGNHLIRMKTSYVKRRNKFRVKMR